MFKLNLRDLFWLVLVAAILCGWWIEHDNLVRKIGVQARQIEELSGQIPFQCD